MTCLSDLPIDIIYIICSFLSKNKELSLMESIFKIKIKKYSIIKYQFQSQFLNDLKTIKFNKIDFEQTSFNSDDIFEKANNDLFKITNNITISMKQNFTTKLNNLNNLTKLQINYLNNEISIKNLFELKVNTLNCENINLNFPKLKKLVLCKRQNNFDFKTLTRLNSLQIYHENRKSKLYDVFTLTNLTRLKINSTATINDEELFKMTQLQKLSIRKICFKNELKNIGKLENLIKLTILPRTNHNINTISFNHLSKLSKLKITADYDLIIQIPYLSQLKKLSVSSDCNNYDMILKLTNLKSLSLNLRQFYPHLNKIDFKYLVNIKNLQLKNADIINFQNLTQIKKLKLNGFSSQKYIDKIEKFTELKKLYFYDVWSFSKENMNKLSSYNNINKIIFKKCGFYQEMNFKDFDKNIFVFKV
jgi:hypothetical protein